LASTFRNTIFEVNLNAISHNYIYFKNKLNPKTKIMAVVKAFAYGHGAIAVSKHLEEKGVDYLAVAFIDEGVEIYQSGVQLPILIFNPNPEEFEAIVDNKLEPTIYNLAFLKDFLVYLAKNNIKNYPIHIKLDTGMHRSGFLTNDLEELKTVINTDLISIKSIYSHLAASEDLAEKNFTQQQITFLKKNAAYISNNLYQKPLVHILNSAGIIHYPEAQFDMVRLGISLYGSSPLKKIQKKLQAVGSLKSVITQIRTIEKGETVSYNRKFKTTKKTTIATVPIGYADGINRRLGNGNSTVLVNGSLIPIVGTICMDSLMLDITNIDIQIGDVVLFFGAAYSVQKVAAALDTISYEIFTNVSKRVKRVYTK
jgi:alanine racemase